MNPFSYAAKFMIQYDKLDRILVKAGFPATTAWWRAELERFVRSPGIRWVPRVGRRGGKSSTMVRVAVVRALSGQWKHSPGDVPVVSFLSTVVESASDRLTMVAAILDVLGVKYSKSARELTIQGPRPVSFRAVTSSLKGAVSFTSIAIFADEMALWETEGANPAEDIIASITPTLAGVDHPMVVCYSAPWSTDDYHAKLFDEGDTDYQVVSFAPTWIARPDLTEEMTHVLAPDPREWNRAYAAIPSDVVSAALVHDDVVACFTRGLQGHPTSAFVAIDPSNMGGGDTFSWIAGRISNLGEVAVEEIDGYEGKEHAGATTADAIAAVADVARRWNVTVVHGDQGSGSGALGALFAQQGITYLPLAWTVDTKNDAVLTLRRWMRSGQLYLAKHGQHLGGVCRCKSETLKRQMLELKGRAAPSGKMQYATGGEDYVSALITVAHAVNAGTLWAAGGGAQWAERYEAGAGALNPTVDTGALTGDVAGGSVTGLGQGGW